MKSWGLVWVLTGRPSMFVGVLRGLWCQGKMRGRLGSRYGARVGGRKTLKLLHVKSFFLLVIAS